MSDFPRWKAWLVVVVLVFGLVWALPNIFQKQPAIQIQANTGATVNSALQTRIVSILAKNQVKSGKITITTTKSGTHLLARFSSTATQLKAYSLIRDALGDRYVVALNLASTVPGWLRAIGANAMPLGLDLQGGVHFLLQVDTQAVIHQQLQRFQEDIHDSLSQKKIKFEGVTLNGNDIVVHVADEKSLDAARALISREDTQLDLSTSSMAAGGYQLRATLKPSELQKIETSIIHQNLATMRNRVNQLGVSEPLVQQQGTSRIVVELPGMQDTAEAKKVLGATATLEYHAVDENVSDPLAAQKNGTLPPQDRLYTDRQGKAYALKKKIIASGDELIDATAGLDQTTGLPEVSVVLDSAAAKRMFEFTSANVGKLMAVVYIERIPEIKVIDGKRVHTSKVKEVVINASTIQGVFGKRFQSTGLSTQQARTLALLLKSGSLAAPMNVVEERVIGPSLGQSNIDRGLLSVLLGLGFVLIAAGIYYKLFGLVADIALVFNLILLVAVLSVFQATLTMPSIAGIVLTLGMAIDANVLICERIREEMRNGSTPLASIRAGYQKAWSTILDANVTHLIASVALMTFGSGAIRGFAITLGVGILTSMFTSVTATHAITAKIHGGRKLKTLSV